VRPKARGRLLLNNSFPTTHTERSKEKKNCIRWSFLHDCCLDTFDILRFFTFDSTCIVAGICRGLLHSIFASDLFGFSRLRFEVVFCRHDDTKLYIRTNISDGRTKRKMNSCQEITGLAMAFFFRSATLLFPLFDSRWAFRPAAFSRPFFSVSRERLIFERWGLGELFPTPK
jgi:hypothetical protein